MASVAKHAQIFEENDMNEEDEILIRLQIVEAVCNAACGNESLAPYNIPDLCESLLQWVKKK
jgi:hypothetical protein